ncbi:hypothetical protein MNBD_GAMMA12-1545, partial [hydrothermal vent metagenome]
AGIPLSLVLNDLRPEENANDRFAIIIYDQANRPVFSIDAYGYVTQNFYDGAGKVTDVIAYNTAIDLSLLPEAPQISDITLVASSSDRLVRTFYDNDGNLIASLDSEGYLSENFYDTAGRVFNNIVYATQTDPVNQVSGDLASLRPATSLDDISSYIFYNAQNQVVARLDGENFLTQITYDVSGNVTQITAYANRAAAWFLGAQLSDLTPLSSVDDRTVSNSYDSLSRLVSSVSYEGTVSTNTYDAVGNLISTSVAVGTSEVRTSTRRYDNEGRVLAELSPIGVDLITQNPTASQAEIDAIWAVHAITNLYDSAGQLLAVTDQNGNKTIFYYDQAGRQIFTVSAEGAVSENRFDSFSQAVEVRAYANLLNATQLAALNGGTVNTLVSSIMSDLASDNDISNFTDYDLRGAVWRAIDAEGYAGINEFNAFGELVTSRQQISSSDFLVSNLLYDNRGLLISSIEDAEGVAALNRTLVTTYDAFGRSIKQTDANGQDYLYGYDKLGRVITVTDPLGNTLSTEYDAFGQTLKTYDASGNAITYIYDNTERSLSIFTAEGI